MVPELDFSFAAPTERLSNLTVHQRCLLGLIESVESPELDEEVRTMISYLYPALRAARLSPTEALRTV
jgi:hypothetical protein